MDFATAKGAIESLIVDVVLLPKLRSGTPAVPKINPFPSA